MPWDVHGCVCALPMWLPASAAHSLGDNCPPATHLTTRMRVPEKKMNGGVMACDVHAVGLRVQRGGGGGVGGALAHTCSELLGSGHWRVRPRDANGGQADVHVPALHAE